MKTLILGMILALPGVAHAADERARRDINGNPSVIGVDETTGEIRKQKFTAEGYAITVSSGPGAPLAAGSATEAKQDTGNTSLASIDTKLPSQGAAATAASIPVNIASDQTVPVSAATLPLPSGAATSANQSTGNTSLSTIAGDTTSIDGKTPSQGQAAMAASVPVAIASDQSAIPVSGTLSVKGSTVSVQIMEGQTLPVSASSLPLPTGAATSANQTTGNSSLSTIAGDTTSLDAKVPAQGTAVIAASLPVNIASDQVVPISASALPLPSGAATSANQTTGNSSLSTIAGDTTSLDAKVPAQGAAVTAASIPVNIASDQTVPVSAASLPLPSGAATSANQSTANSSLSTIAGDTTSIDGKTPSLGQAAEAASVPVVIASDQTDLPVDQSGNDTAFVSTHSVSGSNIEVMQARSTRQSSLICNEGPEIARCGPTAQLTAAIGQRLLTDQCYTPDGTTKPFRGPLSCRSTTGSPTKITTAETD